MLEVTVDRAPTPGSANRTCCWDTPMLEVTVDRAPTPGCAIWISWGTPMLEVTIDGALTTGSAIWIRAPTTGSVIRTWAPTTGSAIIDEDELSWTAATGNEGEADETAGVAAGTGDDDTV